MVVSGISGLLLPFLLSLPSLGLTTLGPDVDGWGRLYHDGAAGATDGPLLRRTPASNLLQEPPDGGPERLHHPFITRRMALRPAAVFIGGGFTFSPAARASESPMAMAWGRDSTLGPFFEPECRVPCLNSCITFPTFPGPFAMGASSDSAGQRDGRGGQRRFSPTLPLSVLGHRAHRQPRGP